MSTVFISIIYISVTITMIPTGIVDINISLLISLRHLFCGLYYPHQYLHTRMSSFNPRVIINQLSSSSPTSFLLSPPLFRSSSLSFSSSLSSFPWDVRQVFPYILAEWPSFLLMLVEWPSLFVGQSLSFAIRSLLSFIYSACEIHCVET